ncbi:MAG: S41 family peptidase, partial [Pirellulales bacterium]|nr:S41 family peptidase [Pirellulales bacterium]
LFIVLVVLGWLLPDAAQDRTGQGKRFAEVIHRIDKEYFRTIDAEQLFEAAMKGVFRELDDDSEFIESSELKKYEKESKEEFAGIGVELDAKRSSGDVVVVAPVFGGPAWQAGIRPGDRIVSVEGLETSGRKISEIVSQFRGEVGSKVNLGIRRQDVSTNELSAAQDITISRQNIRIESVRGDRRLPSGKWDWWLEGNSRIAYLRITYFGNRTSLEITELIEQLLIEHSPEGLVIDLRGNSGGSLEAGVELCDLFLEEGLIAVLTNDRKTSRSNRKQFQKKWLATSGQVLRGVPIAVLVDEFTSGVAEIVAACLQDHKRATIVGSRSFGNASVQTVTTLSSGPGAIRLTTNEYQRPSGASLNRSSKSNESDVWGVRPDSNFAFSPTRKQLEDWISWRQDRDRVSSVQSGKALDPGGLLPRHTDPVLGRALTLFE